MNGMTIARKPLSERALPGVENILLVYAVWNNLNDTSGKKYCRMPKYDTIPEDANST